MPPEHCSPSAHCSDCPRCDPTSTRPADLAVGVDRPETGADAERDANIGNAWRPYSEEPARLIDAEVRRLLDESYAALERESLDEQESCASTGLRPAPYHGVLRLPVRRGPIRPCCEHLTKGGS
jgi:hypothetical protein